MLMDSTMKLLEFCPVTFANIICTARSALELFTNSVGFGTFKFIIKITLGSIVVVEVVGDVVGDVDVDVVGGNHGGGAVRPPKTDQHHC
jgi:hypothetical protein